MSLAIPYAKAASRFKKHTGCQLYEEPILVGMLNIFRKTQIRLDNLILKHAVAVILVQTPTSLELSHIATSLKELFQIDVSRNLIKKVALRPLCKIELCSAKKERDGTITRRLYSRTPALAEEISDLEGNIVTLFDELGLWNHL